MSGYHLSVYRQMTDRGSPSEFKCVRSSKLAEWQADVFGLDWLFELAKQEDLGVSLGGDGYPFKFSARASVVIPYLKTSLPDPSRGWSVGEDDVLLPHWAGRTTIDEDAIESCDPDEWLHIEAFDRS